MLNFIPASQSACVRINHPPWLSPIIEDFYVRDLAPRRVFIVIADLLTRMRAGYMIHTTRSILVWSGLSLRPPGNDWVSVASARAFYYVFMCSEWALESWPGPRAPTRGPGTRESSENLESTDEATEQFRNVLYDKADFRELNYSAYFAEINQHRKKSLFRIQFLIPWCPEVRNMLRGVSWYHDYVMNYCDHHVTASIRHLSLSRDSVAGRRRKSLEICGNIFLSLQVASLHDNNQIPSLWVSSRAEMIRVSVRKGTNRIILVKMSQDQDDEVLMLYPCDDDASSPIEIMDKYSDIDQSEEWWYENFCPVNKLRNRERCNPLVDWFNSILESREALNWDESWCQGWSAPKLFICHIRPGERGEESPLSCHQHKSHVSPSSESQTSQRGTMLTYYLMS